MQNSVSIAFLTDGGAGSLFGYANFIYCFREYMKNEPVKIVIFGHKSDDLNELLFGDHGIVDEYYSCNSRSNVYRYDVGVQLRFFPGILFESPRVEKYAPRLHGLLCRWRKFIDEDKGRAYCLKHPHYDYNSYIYGIINHRTALNVADVGGVLGIKRDFTWSLSVEDNDDLLNKFALERGGYITMQRGATPGSMGKDSPKLWPKYHYRELIRLLKVLYPEKKIVQLGELSNSEPLDGVDVNLLGKTTWRELGIFLKHAWLHVDGECGMVHYRAAMHAGASVVLFGLTPMEFYKYDNNINIKSDACKHSCARLTDWWLDRCMRGFEEPPCMTGILPSTVVRRIVAWDRLNKIRDGNVIDGTRFCSHILKDNTSINVDKNFMNKYMSEMDILYYELVESPLGTLKSQVLTENGFCYIPLKDSPTYKFVQGDRKGYEEYIHMLQAEYHDKIHSVEKYEKLMDDMERNGYDSDCYIVTDQEGRILDGQHRAAWLMSRYGESSEVKVLKLYVMHDDKWDFFPFGKVKRSSKVIIYGAGDVGKGYIDQIKYTGYCDIVAVIDRNPERRIENDKIRYVAPENIANITLYDYAILATRNDKNAYDMKVILKQYGVPEEKIIMRCVV